MRNQNQCSREGAGKNSSTSQFYPQTQGTDCGSETDGLTAGSARSLEILMELTIEAMPGEEGETLSAEEMDVLMWMADIFKEALEQARQKVVAEFAAEPEATSEPEATPEPRLLKENFLDWFLEMFGEDPDDDWTCSENCSKPQACSSPYCNCPDPEVLKLLSEKAAGPLFDKLRVTQQPLSPSPSLSDNPVSLSLSKATPAGPLTDKLRVSDNPVSLSLSKATPAGPLTDKLRVSDNPVSLSLSKANLPVKAPGKDETKVIYLPQRLNRATA